MNQISFDQQEICQKMENNYPIKLIITKLKEIYLKVFY